DDAGATARRLGWADPAQPRHRDAQASPRAGRAGRAEGADQDALPARLHDLPGPVRRHPRAGRRIRLPRAQQLMSTPTLPVSEPSTRPEPVSEPVLPASE